MKALYYKLLIWAVKFVAHMPTSKLRVFLYQTIYKYEFNNSYIGFRTEIYVESFSCGQSRIGNNNRFSGPMRVEIGDNVTIGYSNTFECGDWAKEQDPAGTARYPRRVVIADGVHISSQLFFDVVGLFKVGCNSWLAGRDSQFWTHGPGSKERVIKIGANCYVASAVRMAPGTKISDNSLVGMGSVVSGDFTESNLFIAGVPAHVIRKGINWNESQHK
jgi:acetyltransferase-like isoleucine patch superfamily enzyme